MADLRETVVNAAINYVRAAADANAVYQENSRRGASDEAVRLVNLARERARNSHIRLIDAVSALEGEDDRG